MRMENKKLLIVGIDPGITVGCAVLDIEGNLVCLNSSKQLDLNQLISQTIDLGKVILVGTDKFKVPALVSAFATKIGARIVSPQEDLKVNEKREMVSNFNFKDSHEGDALASALFAYKTAKALLDKITFFVQENKKHEIKNSITELVIIKKISIKNAVSIIEKKDEESQIMEKVVFEKKLNEHDFVSVYSKLKRLEMEMKLVKKYNNNLKMRLVHLEKNNNRIPQVGNNKKRIDFREATIRFLENKLRLKEKELEESRLTVKNFNTILSHINDLYILKKLDTLSINEFNFKNKLLNIQKSDMILVDNPNIVSDTLIDLLRNNIFIIVYKQQISKKNESNLPFLFINGKNLIISEDRYFGFVNKRNFEIEKSKINWVKKVIEDYKKEKEHLIY
ncbi:MAG: DUF460 domain-containing protein [Nanoarchaeota archaeon]